MTAKYSDWTRGEDEAILNIIGGTEIARAILRGERKLIIEEVVRAAPASKPPLIGTVVKMLWLKPYKAESIAEAIELGKYSNDTGDIAAQFSADEVGLATGEAVDLVQFNRDPSYDEILAWAKENGDKKPMLTKHLLAIGIQHPEEQRLAPIVEFGSLSRGDVLCLVGTSGWRRLDRDAVTGSWNHHYLFGFLREPTRNA